MRKVRTAALALIVVLGSTAGFLGLSRAFRDDTGSGFGGSGRIVFGRVQLELDPAGGSSSSGPEIWSIAADGSDVRMVLAGDTSPTTPAWSPDGSRIAFLEQDRDADDLGTLRLSTSAPDGSDPIVVTGGLIEPMYPSVAWSPDGSRIAVLDSRAHDLDAFDDYGLPLTEIAVYALDGTRDRFVDVPGTASGFTWWPDGQGFAVAASDARGDVDLVRVDLRGHIVTVLMEDVAPYAPAVSPGADRVAFVRQEPPIGGSHVPVDDIWTVGLDGTHLTRVTDEPGWKPALAWSPDGTRIVFANQTPERCDIVSVALDGSVRTPLADRSTMGGCADEISVSGSMPSPASPEPGVVTEVGRDIGLGVLMCDLEVLEGIDWDGTGIDGAAWTGAPVDEDGRCSSSTDVQHVVAVDRDGDGIAEQASTSTLRSCLLCRLFDTVDLNGDGVLELVVLEEASSTPIYSIFEVNRPGSERALGVYPIIVIAPGAPVMNLDAGEAVRFTVGGDEGFSGSIVCEDAGAGAPILRYTWVRGEVDADTELTVDITRLWFGEDDVFHIESVDHFSVPRNPEPTELRSTEPACGVDFHPDA